MSNRFINAKICEIEINGMKNVLHGDLKFQNMNQIIQKGIQETRFNHITGMYGNNGSGKSTVVETMGFIRDLIKDEKFVEYNGDARIEKRRPLLINVEQKWTENKFTVFLEKEMEQTFLEYSIRIEQVKNMCIVTNEKLRRKRQLKGCAWEAWKTMVEFDRRKEEIRLDARKQSKKGALYTRLMAYQEQREKSDILKSFFFDRTAFDLLVKECSNDLRNTLCDFKEFMTYDLLVLEYDQLAASNHWILPVFVQLSDSNKHVQGILPIVLRPGEKVFVPESLYSSVVQVFYQIHVILQAIIPDLDLEIKNAEEVFNADSERGYSFEWVSRRNGIEIPLLHESLGIKRIISIVSLLVAYYNDSRINLFIDEMDSGVFEHLLGQLVEAFDQKAKGFLFFTAHNLRPLEKIRYKELYFTTVDPSDRYARISVLSNNNPRNVYFYDLNLGREKGADFADIPTTAKIKLGFMKAGKRRNG